MRFKLPRGMLLMIAVEQITSVSQHAADLWAQAWEIWAKGGWAMGAIAINAFIMFCFGAHVLIKILGKRCRLECHPCEKPRKLWLMLGLLLDHPIPSKV